MLGGRGARAGGLLLGALMALGTAIWQFPNPGSVAADPVTTTGSAGGAGGLTANGLTAPAQSALDQVLGAGRSVITALATHGPASSGRTTTYDPKHVVALDQSQVTALGFRGSVTDNGVSRTVTDSRTGGQLQRITVAVVVDSGLRPAPKLAAIRQTVTGAMGLQFRRGDTLTVTRAPIAAAMTSASASAAVVPGVTATTRITSYLPSAVGVGVALVLLLTLAMDSRRRRPRP